MQPIPLKGLVRVAGHSMRCREGAACRTPFCAAFQRLYEHCRALRSWPCSPVCPLCADFHDYVCFRNRAFLVLAKNGWLADAPSRTAAVILDLWKHVSSCPVIRGCSWGTKPSLTCSKAKAYLRHEAACTDATCTCCFLRPELRAARALAQEGKEAIKEKNAVVV